MPINEPVPSEDNELRSKIKAINRKIDAVGAAHTRTKIVSLIVALAIIGVGVYGAYSVYSPFKRAYDRPDPYMKAITADMQDRLVPILQDEGKLLQAKVQPFIVETIQAKFAARQNEITSVAHQELATVMDETKEFAQKEFATRRDRIEAAILERLKKEVPELSDQQNSAVILANAQKAMSGAVERIMAEHMQKHVDSITSIGTNFSIFEIPADVKTMSEEQLRQELTTALGNFAAGAVRNSLAPQTRDQIRQFTDAN